MLPSPFISSPAPLVRVHAALEPAPTILLSMWALTAEDVTVDGWIAQTAAQLSPEQRDFNRWLFMTMGAALVLAPPVASFPDYLGALPGVLAAQPDASPSLNTQVVEHLHTLWETLFAAEWQRHTRLLLKMTQSLNEVIFSQPQWQGVNPVTALRFLLQTEPDDHQLAQLAGVTQIVLALSPHLAAHCTRLAPRDTLWVVRKFDPQLLRRDPLRRAEVLGPLNALADDTRLRILELLVEHGEQRAQEIIARLAGSQGNVSRHLKQLVGAGFVRERRAGDANKLYTYDAAGLQRLQFLARQLLSSHNVQAVGQEIVAELQLSQARAGAPLPLRELLDEQGRITRWPGKVKDQAAMLDYLIEKFAPEHGYSEPQVNEMLQRWYLDADFVLVRRSLVDAGLLRRTKDGARYWRA